MQSTNAIISLTKTNTLSRNTITITHNFMNINSAQFYISADSEEQKNHITKNACFDCNQKKHQHKNCLTNSYNKIHQAITFNENEQAVSFKNTISKKMNENTSSDRQ